MVRKVLLMCGIISSVLYIGTDILASMLWQGYSYANQSISELNAIGAPTRPLTLALFSVYGLLVIAFGIGVWASAGEKRSLRVAAIVLVVYAVVGLATNWFSPMNLRGSETSANDVGHIVLTSLEVLSIVLFIAFGSGAAGKGFRIYSIATILVLVAAGAVAGFLATQMTAQAASTPWAGIVERVNIYATMLWILMFSSVLLRGQAAAPPRVAAAWETDSG
ncbi:MAG: DUF998 domain-containing protein [Actinobacteria bacterium]|nr:DUF998 domain-containing protein [Actinomycetota bacterium]